VSASADYSQEGFDVAKLLGDTDRGWAVAGQLGRDHEAWFALDGADLRPGGTLLVVRLEQPYGGSHTLGRFRLSVTDSPLEVRYPALPGDVRAALRAPRNERTAEHESRIFRHYVGTDAALEAELRLSATQDLAWALANSSAFLFNR
jgi:hypothetical protein